MSALLHLASKIVERVNTEGAASTLRLIGARTRSLVRSLLEDRSRGVWTTRTMKDTELGISDRRNHWYVPTDYETFQRAIQRVSIRAGRDVFVDFGSGMGRIVMLAAALPFRRVIGVEFSPQLHEIAMSNLETAGRTNVELALADATTWEIPADATVLYFFNPFDGEILTMVFANIRRSLREHPRRLTIIYVRPDKFFEKQVAWRDWLTRTAQLPCVEGKVSIYESTAVVAARHHWRSESCPAGGMAEHALA